MLLWMAVLQKFQNLPSDRHKIIEFIVIINKYCCFPSFIDPSAPYPKPQNPLSE
jgi:hypothetical protein